METARREITLLQDVSPLAWMLHPPRRVAPECRILGLSVFAIMHNFIISKISQGEMSEKQNILIRAQQAVNDRRSSCTKWSKKTDTHFYFWDNFGNSAPILTILSLLQAEIYGALT